MKANEEPLTSIILKALALISILGSLYAFGALMFDAGPVAGADIHALDKAAAYRGSMMIMGMGLAAFSICLWWMASILTLLARIADQQASAPLPLPKMTTNHPRVNQGSKPLLKELSTDSAVAEYKL